MLIQILVKPNSKEEVQKNMLDINLKIILSIMYTLLPNRRIVGI